MQTLNSSLDFGYPWVLSYGHLSAFVIAAALLALAGWRNWPRWAAILLGIITLWALVSFGIIRTHFNANSVGAMPTESFFTSGEGRIVDLGAGTGRSTIMIRQARPHAEVVAVDLFGASFDAHFGRGMSPEDRLRANLRAAGVEQRVTIQKADVRKLPFPEASFDAALSAYVMDHLGRDGAKQAFAETLRVLKPGGEFLFMIVGNDAWVKFAVGPMLTHSARSPAAWSAMLEEAGFQIVERGTPPMMVYLLARKP